VLVDGTIFPTWEQMDNAGAVLGHLRRCSDLDHVSAARAAYSNDTIVEEQHQPVTPVGRQMDFTTTGLVQAWILPERCRGRE
jgi:hypothetical protein